MRIEWRNQILSRSGLRKLGRGLIQTLQRMADELKVPLNYLFCDSTESAELACLIDRLSIEERQELIKQLSK